MADATPNSFPPDPSQLADQELWIKAKTTDGQAYFCKYALAGTVTVLPPGAKAFYAPQHAVTPSKRPRSLESSAPKPPHVRNLNVQPSNSGIPWKRKRSGDAKLQAVASQYNYRPKTPDAVIELSSEGDDSPAPKKEKKKRQLQYNTCKICQRYWRAEDRRKPGELKKHDVPPCKIHGHRHRPPCTPPNFWKQAHLSPPGSPGPKSPEKSVSNEKLNVEKRPESPLNSTLEL